MPYVIGITGGIGSGKSTVARVFQSLGVPVYNADTRAKFLTDNNQEILVNIRNEFGESVFDANVLNRKELAKIVFNNKDKLAVLNGIIHPVVRDDFNQWLANADSPYVLKEAAIMIESGSYKQLDELIVVTAPLEMRISRVMKRDNTGREDVIQRMKNQLSDEQRIQFADVIFQNDNSTLLIPQIIQYNNKIIAKLNAQ